MKRDDSIMPPSPDLTEAEAWRRFEKAVDGAVKHGPIRPEPTPARRRQGANKRRNPKS